MREIIFSLNFNFFFFFDVFCEEKQCTIINITIGSTENVYHVTRQNLHFAHTPCNKNKNKKWQLMPPLVEMFIVIL